LGFGDECTNKFKQDNDNPDSFFNKINKIFEKLPLAAIVEDRIFCVHGGIGNTIKNLN
jgi:diadenosine tetraphosphatase ApaH/serine/threonine PP2A family protein phosphatase